MMELYMPPTWAKIPKQSEWYKSTETFKRRSKASKERMRKYWSDGRHRRRVSKQAKPVDVFDLDGRYIATYPSARKCAIAMFPEVDYRSAERCIRGIRQGVHGKKSYRGYMFRDHVVGRGDIEPYRKEPRKKGHRYKDGIVKPNLRKAVVETCEFGVLGEWDSLTACAAALGCSYQSIWSAMREGRTVKGHKLEFKDKQP